MIPRFLFCKAGLNPAFAAGPKTEWMLRDVCVGVGANLSAGLENHIWASRSLLV